MMQRPLHPLRPHRFRPLAEINVTPLVDVMLVLLVVFMITAPMLAAGIKVDLPHATSAKPLPPQEPLIVSIRSNGEILLGSEIVERATLVAAIRAKMGDDVTRSIHLRGDRLALYGSLVGVVDQLAAGGLSRIALITQSGGDTAP